MIYLYANGSDPDLAAARSRHGGPNTGEEQFGFARPVCWLGEEAAPVFASAGIHTRPPDVVLVRKMLQLVYECECVTAAVTPRDRDSGELRYSLRSLDKFAPWFRGDIIIVQGDDRPPSWLNLSHPRVRIVKHGSFFKDPSHLPTFNSDAIQVNLHRMAELGERFIYMNDDFFLGAPVKPTDWFRDGKPVMYFEKYVILGGRASAAELKAKKGNVWRSKIYNTKGLLEDTFPDELKTRSDLVVHFVKHAPQPLAVLRHVLEDMEKLWPMEYRRTSAARFRTHDTIDVSLLHQLYCQVWTP